MTPPRPWAVEAVSGPAADLHRSSVDLIAGAPASAPPHGLQPRPGRVVRILDATGPAVVLGSSEPDSHVDRHRAEQRGLGVVRRRSGGAAVLVGPGVALWVDVVIPGDDPLWSADVSRSAWWLGACWAAALTDVGIVGADVWRGAMVVSAWSSRICFAGLGPGEVTVAGAKVVGISQRRTRNGALFQCAVPLAPIAAGGLVAWDPRSLLDVLALEPAERQRAATELVGVAGAFGDGPGLAAALVARLGCARPEGVDGCDEPLPRSPVP